jgi:hypothetical protein
VSEDGGFRSLNKNVGTNSFVGSISVSGEAPQRRTIIVRYGTFYQPFDVRVHRFLGTIGFAVEHEKQPSCTSIRVQEAGSYSDSLPDSINREINAGELMAIPEPNRCDANLRLAAARAKYRQSVRMSQLSNGLFLINPEIKQQYELIAAERGVPVQMEVAAYDKQDQELEAKQLATVRSLAQAEGDYTRALQVNDYMAERVETGKGVAAFYRKQGVTSTGLAADSKYLQALAVKQAAASTQEIQPQVDVPKSPELQPKPPK